MPPPSVDALARMLAAGSDAPHALLVDAARAAIAAAAGGAAAIGAGGAAAIGAGGGSAEVDQAEVLEAARRILVGWEREGLVPVINATGVLLHTNLGRAPAAAPRASQRPFDAVATGRVRYSNLEYRLDAGGRGSRRALVTRPLRLLTGAEDALVVNNGAAAVLLALAAIAAPDGVAVSRGELVEIGGGFRIPDVCAQSGARLVEVGTTNRTRAADYARAIAEEGTITAEPGGPARTQPHIAALLKVHRSNYRISGFTEETSVAALAALGPPVIHDLGSGLLDARLPWLADASGRVPDVAWLRGEPGVRQSLDDGAALVVCSGDKLLGGPQAGIIAGRADLVERCARHPLARALRPGALVLSALAEVLDRHLRREPQAVPFWSSALRSADALRGRAEAIAAAVAHPRVTAVPCASTPGGGTLPDAEIASYGLSVERDVTAALRACTPPVIARVERGRTMLDLRTVDPGDDGVLTQALRACMPPTAAHSATAHSATAPAGGGAPDDAGTTS